MIGDRLDTDVKFDIDGKLGGTLLDLTGVSRTEDLEATVSDSLPSAYAERLSDLFIH